MLWLINYNILLCVSTYYICFFVLPYFVLLCIVLPYFVLLCIVLPYFVLLCIVYCVLCILYSVLCIFCVYIVYCLCLVFCVTLSCVTVYYVLCFYVLCIVFLCIVYCVPMYCRFSKRIDYVVDKSVGNPSGFQQIYCVPMYCVTVYCVTPYSVALYSVPMYCPMYCRFSKRIWDKVVKDPKGLQLGGTLSLWVPRHNFIVVNIQSATINTSLLVFIFVNNLKVVRYNKYQFTGIYLCEQP